MVCMSVLCVSIKIVSHYLQRLEFIQSNSDRVGERERQTETVRQRETERQTQRGRTQNILL